MALMTIESAIKLLKTYDNPQDLIKIVWKRQRINDQRVTETELLKDLDSNKKAIDNEWPTDY